MKKLSLFVFVFVFSLITAQLKAQVKFGPKAGLNLTEMSLKSGDLSYNPSTVAGFHVGFILETRINKHFYLQPGIFYSTKGSNYKIGMENVSISPDYIEIPVNFLWKINLKGTAKLLIYTGPYFAAGIAGSYNINGNSKKIKFGTSASDDLKPFDYGLNFGVGFEIHHFQITGQYGYGLMNLNPDKSAKYTVNIAGLFFSVGYLIGK